MNTMIDTLDDRQRLLLTALRDNLPLDARQKFSASALVAAGFLSVNDQHEFSLSKTGIALFESQAIEGQAISAFSVNDQVEVSLWFRRFTKRSNVSWAHEWDAATVIALSLTRVQVRFLDGLVGFHLPGRVRHAPALH